MSWQVVVTAFIGLFISSRFTREKLLLVAWWLLPFLALAMFGRVLYPRFILFMTMPILPLAGSAIVFVYEKMRNTLLKYALLSFIVFPSIFSGYYIIVNPLYAPIPFADKGQFVDDWPSGWGVAETVGYLSREADKGKLSIYTDGTFGLLPYAIELYLVDHPNVTITGVWPMPASPSAEMRRDAQEVPTYLVLNLIQKLPKWPLTLIGEWQKGNSEEIKLRLFRLNAEEL